MQYLTVQIVLTERKGKSNYRFPSIVKNNGKEDMNFSKVRRKEEKWLAQIFRKDLIEREKTRNMNQNNAFCLPLIGFFTQSSQYIRFKKKICSYSMVHMMGVLNLCIFFYLGILSRFTVQQGKG